MAKWQIVGQVGTIVKKDKCYLVNIAENKYKPKGKGKEWEKQHTIWFNCICDFEPKVSMGDTVIAEGEYLPSKRDDYPYVMKIAHIGVIKKKV